MTDFTPLIPEQEDQTITEDCPCVNCGQNLRGLKPDDQCPTCHEPVATTLELAIDEVLCMACMRPNPQGLTNCYFCSAPLTNAGTITNYAAGKLPMPSALLKSDDTLEERLAHARSRMWIGLVFFGPSTFLMLSLAKGILYAWVTDPIELLLAPIPALFSILALAIFGGLIWLEYFLINRYMQLKVESAESKQKSPDNTKIP